MSRKDYELIASILRAQREELLAELELLDKPGATRAVLAVDETAFCLASALKRDNPRFDVDRFLTAAGYDTWPANPTRRTR